MSKPLKVDEEFFFAVLPRGATVVQIVARDRDEELVVDIGDAFVRERCGPRGRWIRGVCRVWISNEEIASAVAEVFESSILPGPAL